MADCYHDEHHSGLHRVGARPGDALEFLRSVDVGRSIADNAVASFQQRWYGDVKQKYAVELTRHFGTRFRFGRGSHTFGSLRRFVLVSDPTAFPLVNHFFMLMVDPYYRWAAAEFVPARYAQGRPEITNAAFVPELQKHLPGTIGTRTAIRYGQSVLTSLRDNGVLAGKVKKTVTPPELSVELLGFFLYWHAECGIGAGEFQRTPLFSSLLRAPEAYVPLFHEGERRGYWEFVGDASRLSAHLAFRGVDVWVVAETGGAA
ncbi:MAG: hypothetical protein WD492_05855 [Alkalispirochaeta sp.]